MCPDCNKDVKIHAQGVCKKCYNYAYSQKYHREKSNDWWKKIDISSKDKELIRLSLLRYKWSYETPIDAMILIHFYLQYKKESMANFENYRTSHYIDKIRKQIQKIFK